MFSKFSKVTNIFGHIKMPKVKYSMRQVLDYFNLSESCNYGMTLMKRNLI